MGDDPAGPGQGGADLASTNPQLFEAFAAELKRMAQSAMAAERPDHTLQPTALVNEAFLRMAGKTPSWINRAHFLASAANVMRQILIDHARARRTLKRGADPVRVEMADPVSLAHSEPDRLLAVDQAIQRLGEIDPRAERVVELRYYAGLSVEEAADALGVSPKTVKRDWQFARVWLEQQLQEKPPL